jgi:hypothetical protein
MSDNKERDRIMREARSLLDSKPAPYQYVPPPRMLGDDIEEPFVPAPARSPRLDTRATPQPQPAPDTATDWGPWEAWISARIDAALIVEREAIAEIMAEAIGRCMARERRELHAQLAELKREKRNRADEAFVRAMKHFEELVEMEKNRILDLPALSARRDFN